MREKIERERLQEGGGGYCWDKSARDPEAHSAITLVYWLVCIVQKRGCIGWKMKRAPRRVYCVCAQELSSGTKAEKLKEAKKKKKSSIDSHFFIVVIFFFFCRRQIGKLKDLKENKKYKKKKKLSRWILREVPTSWQPATKTFALMRYYYYTILSSSPFLSGRT